MKIGVRINVDVTKLDKEHFFKGDKGTYCDLVVFIDDQPDAYGRNGGVKQTWKDCDDKQQDYVGNCKIFWSDSSAPSREMPPADDSDELPF